MLCKEWTDKTGKVHPGLYDENSKDMKRWAEANPKAIRGRMWLIEPTKYRNMMFDATHRLVQSGIVEFPPQCPKYDTLVLEDGTERKLSKTEMASLIQMDLMKEEMVYMTRFKTPKGIVTYGLPPEKARKMHDDRNYVAIMTLLYIDKLRAEGGLGEPAAVDFSAFFEAPKTYEQVKKELPEADSGWTNMMGGRSGRRISNNSPFKGNNPFR